MEIFANKEKNSLTKEISEEQEEYLENKSEPVVENEEVPHEVESFKEFPYFISFHHTLLNEKDYLNKFNLIFNATFAVKHPYLLKMLSYDQAYEKLSKIEEFENIEGFTYQEYRKYFDLYYSFLVTFMQFKTELGNASYVTQLFDLFEAYYNLFFGAAVNGDFSYILRDQSKIKEIYSKAIQQNKLVKEHINVCFKLLDRLYTAYKNLERVNTYYLGLMMDTNSSALFVQYPDKERRLSSNIFQFNSSLKKILSKIKSKNVNPELLPIAHKKIDEGIVDLDSTSLYSLSSLQKEIGLSNKELEDIISIIKETSLNKTINNIARIIQSCKEYFVLLKQAKTELTPELLEDIINNIHPNDLYLKYGNKVASLLLNHNKYALNNIKDFFSKPNIIKPFQHLNKLMPGLGTNLVKWMMGKSPEAWYFYNNIYGIYTYGFEELCKIFPKIDINICKKEFKIIKEITLLMVEFERIIEFAFSNFMEEIAENFKFTNLNSVLNFFKKLIVIARAMHNNGYYLTNNNFNMAFSFLKSSWDPTSDIISKFINVVFNEKLEQIFNKKYHQFPEEIRGRTSEAEETINAAHKFKIDLDKIRQSLLKFKMKFFAGEPISSSEKSEIYNLSENINLLLSFSTISKYYDQVENKAPELYNLAFQIDGFEFKVLPQASPQHFQVGAATNCCQSIGGAGENAAVDSFINSLAGVVVLSKEKNLIAQSYFHYVPEDNGYILDNVEVNDGNVSKYSVNLENLYAELAQYMKNKFNIKYFRCGKEYNSLNNDAFENSSLKTDPRKFSVDDPYSDFDESDHIDLLAPKKFLKSRLFFKR